MWRNGVGLRGHGGTRVPGYKVTCLTTTTACAPCTPRPRPARLQPAAQSHPSHPTFCSKGGSPKTSLLPFGFFGIVAAPGRGGALVGWVDGLGEQRPFCYVGPPSAGPMVQGRCHCPHGPVRVSWDLPQKGTGRAASPHRPNNRQHVELNSL